MDESRFFELIDEARDSREPTSPSADPEALEPVLKRLDDDELIGFMIEFRRQLARLNSWRVWGAGYVAAGGMSDDSFHYFRSWLIGKGPDVVAQALSDPDGLADFIDEHEEEFDNEVLEYVALEILDERGLDDPRDLAGVEVDGGPEGQVFDEEAVFSDYPQLAARSSAA